MGKTRRKAGKGKSGKRRASTTESSASSYSSSGSSRSSSDSSSSSSSSTSSSNSSSNSSSSSSSDSDSDSSSGRDAKGAVHFTTSAGTPSSLRHKHKHSTRLKPLTRKQADALWMDRPDDVPLKDLHPSLIKKLRKQGKNIHDIGLEEAHPELADKGKNKKGKKRKGKR
eukprot:TRINITY_DN1541_c0_g3_i2.p1 TRINITY_DN1541_c0_g3~~TRINITY_DN1541_c0_g3_i2.p1  ORF type:complete len:169 (+),score=40.84 TRINITY_DN1541_c0_g3_i2:325-831(+)